MTAAFCAAPHLDEADLQASLEPRLSALRPPLLLNEIIQCLALGSAMFKSLDTVRVTSIDVSVTERQLVQLFENHHLRPLRWSLCYQPSVNNDTRYQVATVSFATEPEAKKALALHGCSLGDHCISVDCDFSGLTPLFSPKSPAIE